MGTVIKSRWTKTTLGDICQIRGGGTPSKAIERYWRGDIPWLSPKDMKTDTVSDSIDHISAEAVDSSATSIIPKGSILMVVRSGILARTIPIAVTGRDLAINQDLKALCPNKEINVEFLYHLLGSKESFLLSRVSRGATVHRLMTEDIRSLEITLPPLPEQRWIVGTLDKAFEGIATAKANAEKNLQNARALFKSSLEEIFCRGAEGWIKRRLGELARINYGYTESASTEKVGPKFLRITDIQDNCVDWDSVPYCRIAEKDFPKYRLEDGDIVFARTGATTGKSFLVVNPPKAIFASYLIRVHLMTEGLLPSFLYLFFQTHSYWDRIYSGVTGSAQGGFNATKLGELIIPFPVSLNEQRSVINRLDELSSETQRLESICQRKLAALDELKKSLLHQAFSGNL